MEALSIEETNAETLHLLGVTAHLRGNDKKAVDYYKTAIHYSPDQFSYHYHQGVSLQKLKRFKEAISCYQQALSLNPDSLDTLENLGCALLENGRPSQAIELLQQVVKRKPDSAASHFNLGEAYRKIKQYQNALDHLAAAVNLNPEFPEAHIGLGQILSKQGDMTPARYHFNKALEQQPQNKIIYDNLASVDRDQGRINDALSHHEKALSFQPDDAATHSSRLVTLLYWYGNEGGRLLKEHKIWNEQHAQHLLTATPHFINAKIIDRRLRIGYVSPDFRLHSVSFFLEPLLKHHDKSHFEIICYSDVEEKDTITSRLKETSDTWHDIKGIPDTEVVDRIIKDRIDILVDLTGHFADNRMLVFARKPAPVQVTYIGYPCTTGLSTMDYRLTDKWADPKGVTDSFHTEELIRLPHGFLCYLPPADSPAPDSAPRPHGRNITFASFNNLSKISPDAVKTWARILKEVSNSTLVMKSKPLDDEGVKDDLRARFQEEGIPASRIRLSGFKMTVKEHLSLYNTVDIALDTFPYNGTTTTCEALWMGVPVITREGNTHVSRVGSSLLSRLGLTELVAATRDEYIKKAVRLAGDRKKLQDFRAELRPLMIRSNLLHAEEFTRTLENAYWDMWKKWCKL